MNNGGLELSNHDSLDEHAFTPRTLNMREPMFPDINLSGNENEQSDNDD